LALECTNNISNMCFMCNTNVQEASKLNMLSKSLLDWPSQIVWLTIKTRKYGDYRKDRTNST